MERGGRGKQRTFSDEYKTEAVFQIRRRGVEMRLVIEGNRAPAPRADLALLKAVARAHHWSDELLSGRVPSIAKIAERERSARATSDD